MPTAERINDIINVAAIKQQVAETSSALHIVLADMTAITEASAKLMVDFGGLKGTKAMVDAIKELEKAQKESAATNEKLIKTVKEKEALEKKLATASTNRQKTQEGENSMVAEAIRLEKKLADMKTEEAKIVFELKRRISELAAERKHEAEMIDAATGSIIEMERTTKLLTKQYDQLSEADRQASGGMKLAEKINVLNNEIRESKVALGNMKANVGNYHKSLDGLNVSVKGLTDSEKKLAAAQKAKNTKEIEAAQKALNNQRQKALAILAEQEAKETRLRDAINKEANTVEELMFQTKALTTVRNRLDRSTREGAAEFDRLTEKIKANKAQLRSLQVATGGNWTSKLKNGISGMIATWTALTASLYAAFYAAKKLVYLNADLDDSMANVRRTTQLTNAEVHALNKTFRSFDTRTSQTSLLDLAHVAGKLGIAKDEIVGFVKAADMIGVSLGKDFANNEEAINQLGRLVTIFANDIRPDEIGMEKALLKVGSALKDLGIASVAEEKNILDFTKRIGGIAPIAGMSIDKVMGLGATFDILGQTMEVSATAVTRVWVAMSQHPEKFAKIAGKSVKDFIDLMRVDFNQAFVEFVKGLNDADADILELSKNLDGLGIEGYRTIQALSVLSDKTGLYAEQTKIAKESLGAGTTALQQFQIQNETAGAELEKATKALKNMVANESALKFMAGAVRLLTWEFEQLQKVLSGLSTAFFSGINLFMPSIPKKSTATVADDKDQKARMQQEAIDIKTLSLLEAKNRESFIQEREKTANELLKMWKKSEGEARKHYAVEYMYAKKHAENLRKLQAPTGKKEKLSEYSEDGTKKTAAQIKLEKQLAAERAKLLKEEEKNAKKLEKLYEAGDQAIEKGYQLRAEAGLVSLKEQERHEKGAMDARIKEINDNGTKQLIIEAEINAKKNSLTDKQLKEQIEKIEQNADRQIISLEEKEEIMYSITLKYIDKALDAERKKADEIKKIQQSTINNVKSEMTVRIDTDVLGLTEARVGELEGIRGQLEKREITVEEFRKKEHEINQKYDKLEIEATIEAVNTAIGVLQGQYLEESGLAHKLAQLKMDLNRMVADDAIDNIERETEKNEEAYQKIKETAEELYWAWNDLVSTLYEAESVKVDAKIEENKEAWDAELDAAKGNEKMEKQINSRRAANEKKLSEEKKRLAAEQASSNKAFAIFAAIINTAVAVTKALDLGPPLGFIMAALTGILGAVEIATIASQPVPQYAEGREGGKAEMAIVGEEGKEAIQYKTGEVYLTPDTPTLTYLPEGARVLPHEDIGGFTRASTMFSTPTLSVPKNSFTVNVDSPYAKEMLWEMRRKKQDTKIFMQGDMVVYETGDRRLIVRQ